MKKAAMLLLAAALAVPAMPAVAQDAPAAADSAPVIGTNWSLKPKAKPKPKPQAQVGASGPSVPPPQRLRNPRSRTAQARAAPRKVRPNNQPLVNAIASGKRLRRD